MIYIYDDGIHNNAYLQLAVNSVLPDEDIRFCTANMVFDGCLNNSRLLIMPGGADLYFCEKLNGNGNQLIRDFVAQGGSYLGICAGAYYGSSTLDWNKDEIAGPRELAFYEGCATGPVHEWIETPDSIYESSWKKPVRIETTTDGSFLTLYDGGPVFDEPSLLSSPRHEEAKLTNSHSGDPASQTPAQGEGDDNYIIARYTDLPDAPPAIVGGTLGDGQYILSSPHIEKFGHLLSDGLYKLHNNSYEREKKVTKDLLPHEQKQKNFFKSILERLL